MQVEAGQAVFGSPPDCIRNQAVQDLQAQKVAVTDNAVNEQASWSPPILLWGVLGAASWLPVLICCYFLLG